jgi:hypothetical protein
VLQLPQVFWDKDIPVALDSMMEPILVVVVVQVLQEPPLALRAPQLDPAVPVSADLA